MVDDFYKALQSVGPQWYILDDNDNPVPCDDILKWGEFMESINRRLTKKSNFADIGVEVSTVFLGMDHSFYGDRSDPDHLPVLWETMIFGGKYDQYQRRYTSREDALVGHQEAVDMLLAGRLLDE